MIRKLAVDEYLKTWQHKYIWFEQCEYTYTKASSFQLQSLFKH